MLTIILRLQLNIFLSNVQFRESDVRAPINRYMFVMRIVFRLFVLIGIDRPLTAEGRPDVVWRDCQPRKVLRFTHHDRLMQLREVIN